MIATLPANRNLPNWRVTGTVYPEGSGPWGFFFHTA